MRIGGGRVVTGAEHGRGHRALDGGAAAEDKRGEEFWMTGRTPSQRFLCSIGRGLAGRFSRAMATPLLGRVHPVALGASCTRADEPLYLFTCTRPPRLVPLICRPQVSTDGVSRAGEHLERQGPRRAVSQRRAWRCAPLHRHRRARGPGRRGRLRAFLGRGDECACPALPSPLTGAELHARAGRANDQVCGRRRAPRDARVVR